MESKTPSDSDPDPPTLWCGYYSTKAERKRWNGGIDPKEETEKATKRLLESMNARRVPRARGEPPKDAQDMIADLWLSYEEHQRQESDRLSAMYYADLVGNGDSLLKLFPKAKPAKKEHKKSDKKRENVTEQKTPEATITTDSPI